MLRQVYSAVRDALIALRQGLTLSARNSICSKRCGLFDGGVAVNLKNRINMNQIRR
jgi:hypothetical protein